MVIVNGPVAEAIGLHPGGNLFGPRGRAHLAPAWLDVPRQWCSWTRKARPPVPVKKIYRTPTLKVFGDLRKITASKGGANNDGIGKPRTKSSFPNQ